MRRIPAVPGGAWLDHVWWPDKSAPEYLVARAAFYKRFRLRMARIMAMIELERGELLSWPGEDR
jgi:hypothetical protein